jgi:hypothetical protein
MNGSNRKEAGKSGQVSHKGLGLNFFLQIELCTSFNSGGNRCTSSITTHLPDGTARN